MKSARLRYRLLVLLGVAAAMLAIVAYEANALRGIELSTRDARFSIRGERTAQGLITVLIGETTLDELKRNRYPFPRSFHARVIDALRRDRARLIAYDVLFTEPTDAREDSALINAAARARPVVLAAARVDEHGDPNVFGGADVLRDIGARAGSVNYRLDPGAVFRHVPYKVDKLESFAVAAAEAADRRSIRPSDLGGQSALIDYAGPPDTIPSVSFVDVLRARFRPGTFRGKIVVIGASDPTLQDVHRTSTTGDGLMSGPEIQANAIDTVRRGAPLRAEGAALDRLLIALLTLLVPLACLRLRSTQALVLGAVAAIAYLVTTQLTFNAGTVLPVAYPLAGLVFTAIGSIVVDSLFAAIEREHVRATFARFVPESVVGQVLARTDDDLRLGGVRMEGTVLFCDIRGFTTFSETRRPEEVIDFLNHYLTEMSDAILDHGGTIVSFMGDGIMAVFGAPLEQPDHADRAVAAAQEMLCERLPRVIAWLCENELADDLRIGIGLNSGPLLSGNYGSARRLEYSAIGDTTNTAARIEARTKQSGYQLLLSEATRQRLSHEPAGLEFLEEAELRGRAAQTALYGWDPSLLAADRDD